MGNRVHHLNCVSSCPLGGALMDGRTKSLRGRLACHCLLVESEAGIVLVDTGFEEEHLTRVRTWVAVALSGQAGVELPIGAADEGAGPGIPAP